MPNTITLTTEELDGKWLKLEEVTALPISGMETVVLHSGQVLRKAGRAFHITLYLIWKTGKWQDATDSDGQPYVVWDKYMRDFSKTLLDTCDIRTSVSGMWKVISFYKVWEGQGLPLSDAPDFNINMLDDIKKLGKEWNKETGELIELKQEAEQFFVDSYGLVPGESPKEAMASFLQDSAALIPSEVKAHINTVMGVPNIYLKDIYTEGGEMRFNGYDEGGDVQLKARIQCFSPEAEQFLRKRLRITEQP